MWQCHNLNANSVDTLVLWKVMNSNDPRSNLTLDYQWDSHLHSNMNRETPLFSSGEAMQPLVTPLCLSKELFVSNQEINLETYPGKYDCAPRSDLKRLLKRQRTST